MSGEDKTVNPMDDMDDLERQRSEVERKVDHDTEERKEAARAGEAPQRLGEQLNAAVEAISASAPLKAKGGNALYAVPWMMCVGTPSADIAGMLRHGLSRSGPDAPSHASGGATAWSWWMLQEMVAIECSPDFVRPGRGDRTLTPGADAAFDLLHRKRQLLPLNGLIYMIDVDDLTGDPSALEDHCIGVRNLIEGGYRNTRVRFPVFTVLSGLHKLPGHDGFFDVLPADARAQAIGYRAAVENGRASGQPLFAAYEEIVDQLRQLRLSVLASRTVLADPGGVFTLPEAMDDLKGPVKQIDSALLSDSNWADQPLWRGLYCVAEGAESAHLADLLRRFIPIDGNLAA